MGRRLMLITLIFGLSLAFLISSVSATPTSDGDGHTACYISFVIPVLTLASAMVFLFDYYRVQPVRVYENGLAYKVRRSGDYIFWPWASWETCTYDDHFRLGPVVNIEGGVRSVRLLGTMKAFALVNELLKKKLIPTFV